MEAARRAGGGGNVGVGVGGGPGGCCGGGELGGGELGGCGRSDAELQGEEWRLLAGRASQRLALRKKWWLLSHRSSAPCSSLIMEVLKS